MGGERLYRAQDQPHVPDSVHIRHLDVNHLCAKLAQTVHGGVNGSGVFRLNALSRKTPVKSNPQTTNALLQFIQHMRHGISQRRGIVGSNPAMTSNITAASPARRTMGPA